MNKDTNTYVKKTVVHIRTGLVFDMLTTQPQPTKWEPSPRPVGWKMSELRENGLPDRRTNPVPIGIRSRDYGDGEPIDLSGSHVVHRGAAVEDVAFLLRASIEAAKLALETAEDELIKFYAGVDNTPVA